MKKKSFRACCPNSKTLMRSKNSNEKSTSTANSNLLFRLLEIYEKASQDLTNPRDSCTQLIYTVAQVRNVQKNMIYIYAEMCKRKSPRRHIATYVRVVQGVSRLCLKNPCSQPFLLVTSRFSSATLKTALG